MRITHAAAKTQRKAKIADGMPSTEARLRSRIGSSKNSVRVLDCHMAPPRSTKSVASVTMKEGDAKAGHDEAVEEAHDQRQADHGQQPERPVSLADVEGERGGGEVQ